MAMNKKVNAGDSLMLLLVFGMIVFGLVMIYSASSYTAGLQYGNACYYVKRQIFTVIIGTVMMYMISRPDYHRILKYAWPLYGIALLMLAAVFLIGTASHGQKRWIYIGPVGFQPSEFTKFILIIFLAAMCSAAEPLMKKWKGIILMFLCVMPAAANESQYRSHYSRSIFYYYFYGQPQMGSLFCFDGNGDRHDGRFPEISSLPPGPD